jgi:hypothetical protein
LYWYDLALVYFFEYSALNANNQATDINDQQNAKIVINKSKDCLVNAVNLEPDNYLFWNTLGVLYATDGK